MFQPFQGTPNYPELEQSILKLWDEGHTFDALREKNRDGEPWRFQDGPITANNRMGVHHAWGRTYKDIFNRYHAMRGRRLRWQNGFDCQGLWVEVEVEKALGFKGKPDILAFGLENFSRACRERVEKFAGVISEQSKRLGQWMDWERSYYTFDDSNIEHIWGFLKKCHEEGWLAQDYRVMPWCPRCETSLSQHESADSYKEITHRSVYVKLPIQENGATENGKRFSGDSFLVWTTTPWTLTANVAVALNPELTYVRARTDDGVMILSKGTVATALKPGYEVLGEVPGRELVGLQYSGPFDDLPLQQESQSKTPRRAVAWEDVGETEGTGIVHIAPGCGAEDFELGKREGLGFIVPVTQSAHFVTDAGFLVGKHALDDVETIFDGLRQRDRLYRVQKYAHSYPHCWRCSHELIFNAVQEWFIRADAGERPARQRLRKAAREVEWIPEYAGKRMDDWLANMGDWCISRKRFWGLPLPFYLDEAMGEIVVIGSRAELRERAVDPAKFDALPELHRPWIDDTELRSHDGQRTLKRVPEVGDAWLDAGIVPFSTVGYNGATDLRMPPESGSIDLDYQAKLPEDSRQETLTFSGIGRGEQRTVDAVQQITSSPLFEPLLLREGNLFLKISAGDDLNIGEVQEIVWPIREASGVDEVNLYWGLAFNQDLQDEIQVAVSTQLSGLREWQPADFITEMREQVRLWFFSMLFMSVALEDRAPYKRAMVYETMLDENGERISKTKGNGVPYDEAVAQIGADPMRWTFCGNPLNKDIRFGYGPIHESARKLITLWNVYSFFVTYANLDKPNLSESIVNRHSSFVNPLDRWILARLQRLVGEVSGALENIEPSNITRGVEKFVGDLSTWYVRRSRRRFWKGENDNDKTAAYQTLHHVLLTLCKLIAPVIPFTAEAMYQNLKAPLPNAPQSVHLCDWPQVDESLRDDELIVEVEGVLQCVSLGHAARKESGVKVRQPLSRVLVQAPSPAMRAAIENWRDTVLDELNVKDLELLDDAGELVTYSLKANLPKLGKKLGPKMGAVRQAFENASPEDARRIGEAAKQGEAFTLQVGDEAIDFAADEVLVQTQQQSGYSFASENGWAVALDTTLNDDLIDEGLKNDFVRAVQNARKEAGFEVSDRIAILLAPGEESRLPHVFEKFGDTIQAETLADELRLVPADYPELMQVKIGDESIGLRVEKSV